jgi:hypothetical protein
MRPPSIAAPPAATRTARLLGKSVALSPGHSRGPDSGASSLTRVQSTAGGRATCALATTAVGWVGGGGGGALAPTRVVWPPPGCWSDGGGGGLGLGVADGVGRGVDDGSGVGEDAGAVALALGDTVAEGEAEGAGVGLALGDGLGEGLPPGGFVTITLG